MSTIIEKRLQECDQMSDHLYKTWKKFIDNVDGKNGGKKQNIDLDLIMTEVKLVETQGRQAMLNINAANSAYKGIKAEEKIKQIQSK